MSMLGEPHPHLLIGPSPLEGVGIPPVVLWPTGQHMLDELFPASPRVPLQVVIPEHPHQQLRLVQPRSMGRCESGSPPPLAPRPVVLRVPRRVAGVTILDQA